MTAHKLERYVKKLTRNKGLSEENERELYNEILDHMTLLYEERLSIGDNAKEALKKVKLEFNVNKVFPPDAMENFYTNNNQNYFTWKVLAKVLSIQLIIFYSLLVFLSNSYSTNFEYKLMLMVIDTFVISASAIYLYKLFENIRLVIKSFIMCNAVLFLSRLSIGTAITYLNGRIYLYADNFYGFITLNVIGAVILMFMSNRNNTKQVMQRHNSALVWCILCISFLGLLAYKLFPNNSVLIKGLFELIISDHITSVNKNILYMVVNGELIIPNLGMYLLALLGGAEVLNRVKIKLEKKSNA